VSIPIKTVVTVPYASLLNAKIVEAKQDGSLLIDRHFFIFCMQPVLAKIKVDDDWYLRRYPDVQLAIDSHTVPNASAHYTRHGYFENRMPYRIEVDADWYLREYPDVRLAIEREEFTSAQDHFETVGFAEGRFPYPHFTLATVPEPGDPKSMSAMERVRAVG
jgi:hypothetical protein